MTGPRPKYFVTVAVAAHIIVGVHAGLKRRSQSSPAAKTQEMFAPDLFPVKSRRSVDDFGLGLGLSDLSKNAGKEESVHGQMINTCTKNNVLSNNSNDQALHCSNFEEIKLQEEDSARHGMQMIETQESPVVQCSVNISIQKISINQWTAPI